MTHALFPDLVVNGETVPHALVAAEVQNHDGPKGKPGIAWRKAANAVAVRCLLLQQARNQGVEAEAQEVAPGRFETKEEALIRGLLEQSINVTSPSDEDVRQQWERDPSRFRAPPLWEVSHILVACDPRHAEQVEAAKVRAEALNARALDNPDGFNRLARDESDCGSKSSGGALGQLGPGDTVPEFEAVLRQMTDGEIIPEPVLTRHGWHVIRMDAVAQGTVLPFESVRQKISEAMEKAAWSRAARAIVSDLVERSDITGADLKPI